MAEKKVSVRLVAEGGRRVRAELEGVGEAGARGLGRLSREMELANTRADLGRLGGLFKGWLAGSFERGKPGEKSQIEIRRLLDDIELAEAKVIASVKKLADTP